MSDSWRIVAVAWAVLALWPSPANAQSVDDIIARHVQARGGIDKLRAIQTIKITRTVVTPFSTINVVSYKKRPALFRAEQSMPGQPAIARGVNADAAWDGAPGGTVSVRPPALAAEMREIEADFDGLLIDWKQKGHTVTLDGKVPLPPGDAYKLRVKTKSGLERTIYLDAATYLDRRHVGVLTLPPSPAAVKQLGDKAPPRRFDVVIDYGGWRAVDGVQFPFDIAEERTSEEPVQSFVSYTKSIEVNVPLADTFFATPK